MKIIILNLSKISFAVLILMFLLSGCSTNPVLPIINTFNANPTIIDFGNSITLSWEVSGADTVSIDQGIGIVTASGTIDITPSTRLPILLLQLVIQVLLLPPGLK